MYIKDKDGNYVPTPSSKGADGREVSLRVANNYIQWRYPDTEWTNLVPLSSLKGEPGTDGIDGREVHMRVVSDTLQWRLGDSGTWQTLMSLSTATDGAAFGGMVVDKTLVLAEMEAGSGGGGTADAVTYTPQTLTEEQQAQARTNIGAEKAGTAYTKPASGIPKTDLADDVQTSLAKADTAISYNSQTLTEEQKSQARTNIGAGQPIFAVNVTEVSQGGGYTADKTAAEIEAAYQAGRTIVCKMQARILIGYIPIELPLMSRTKERVFTFAVDQLVRENVIFAITVNISDSRVDVSNNMVEIYEKPADGIPKTDLADNVQTSLDKADAAISLGLTAATPGQIIKVKAVQDGKPTEWETVDMDAGKLPKFTKLLTHTITEDELAASPAAFVWGTAQIPNLNDFNVFVLTIVRPDGAKIKFTKWVRLKINSTVFGNICGTETALSPQYAITANRLFGVWISGAYYDPRDISVPVLVPPGSSCTHQSNLPDSEPVTSIGFTSYGADYGLTAGIVVEIWGAK